MSSGTAALHATMYALGIGPGDEVIVPAMTFAAAANCVVFQEAKPVFVDVDPETLLIDPIQVKGKIASRTKAVIAVDYTGHPADYDELRSIGRRHGLALVADACHNHGISSDHHQRETQASWFYEMLDLGYNYRLTDLQCALGISQLRKLLRWIDRRQTIARRYNEVFSQLTAVEPLVVEENVLKAFHLYIEC